MRSASSAPRYSVENSESELRITIHARRRMWVAVLNGMACGVWATLMVFMLAHEFTITWPNLIFTGLGTLMLVLGLLHTAYRAAWELVGIETITVTRDALLVGLGISSSVRTRRFAFAGMRNLRIPLEHGSWWAEIDAYRNGWQRGIIQLDDHGRRRCFGLGLRVPEAQAILALIETRVARR